MTARIAPLQLMLLALCAVLSLALAYEIAVPVAPFDVPAASYAFKAPASVIPQVASPPSSPAFAEIDARPLFNPARKPVASSGDNTASNAPEPLPSDFSLVGVIIDGSTRMALVRANGTPLAVSMSLGSTVGSWKLVEIDPDKIVMQSASGSQSILLASNRALQTEGPASNASNMTVVPAPPSVVTPNGLVPSSPDPMLVPAKPATGALLVVKPAQTAAPVAAQVPQGPAASALPKPVTAAPAAPPVQTSAMAKPTLIPPPVTAASANSNAKKFRVIKSPDGSPDPYLVPVGK